MSINSIFYFSPMPHQPLDTIEWRIFNWQQPSCSSLGFASRIREQPTWLLVIRHLLCPLFCFILFPLWDSHYIVSHFTRERISITSGDTNCGCCCFLLFFWLASIEFVFVVVVFVLFFYWGARSTLWVCESEERVVRSERHVVIGKLKLKVWSTLPVKRFWTWWIFF